MGPITAQKPPEPTPQADQFADIDFDPDEGFDPEIDGPLGAPPPEEKPAAGKDSQDPSARSAQPASPPQEHPPYVIEQARGVGISQEEIDSTPTEFLNTRIKDRWEAYQRAEQYHRQRQQQAPPPAPPPQPTIPAEPEIDLKKYGIDEEYLDERYVAGLKKVFGDYEKRLVAQQQHLEALTGAYQQQHMQQTAQSVQHVVVSAMAQKPDVFGDGSSQDPMYAFRVDHVGRLVYQMAMNAIQSGQQVTPQQIQQAVEYYSQGYAPIPKQPPPDNTAAEHANENVAKWKRSRTVPATSRLPKDLPYGEERAKRNLAIRAREAGIDLNGDGPSATDEELPDD